MVSPHENFVSCKGPVIKYVYWGGRGGVEGKLGSGEANGHAGHAVHD